MEDVESWVVVHAARQRRRSHDLALVLDAVGIPNLVADDPRGVTLLLVPPERAEAARRELVLYATENPESAQHPPVRLHGYGIPGVLGYALVLLLGFAGQQGFWFHVDWTAGGALDGVAMRAGEWWRAVTALTLHGDPGHLAANLVFGAFFGALAGQYLGSGLAWAVILLSAAAGNVLDVLLLPASHRALGASTAVFAALGLVGAYVWAASRRGILPRQSGWARRSAPVVAALVLLAYIGTGDENTDVVAHLTGFLAGFASGLLLGRRLPEALRGPRMQVLLGAGAAGLLTACWWLVLVRGAGRLA